MRKPCIAFLCFTSPDKYFKKWERLKQACAHTKLSQGRPKVAFTLSVAKSNPGSTRGEPTFRVVLA